MIAGLVYTFTGVSTGFSASMNRLVSVGKEVGQLDTKLSTANVTPKSRGTLVPLNESTFSWQHNADNMATEKLLEGIRNFSIDQNILDERVAACLLRNTDLDCV